MLPDDVLLQIFDFFVDKDSEGIEQWITLAHVCQCWRSVVFQSPHRLNLRLLCTPKTPVRDMLDIWPPLPLIIRGVDDIFLSRVDNIIAALEHNDRGCLIQLRFLTSSQMGYVTNSAAMQKPFPGLSHLQLEMSSQNELGPILPNSFLGGTTPNLRSLKLSSIPFPGLPKLLLSATHLVKLDLYRIPRSGYIPPEVMATSLSALTSLIFLRLHFLYPRPRPSLASRRPPPLTRSILPSLTIIVFKGASEYLEEILAQTDAPQLNSLYITFFNQIIIDTPQFLQLISRRPTLRAPDAGRITLSSDDIVVSFPPKVSEYGKLCVQILCTVLEWQLSSLEQVCTSSLPPLSALEDLFIIEDQSLPPRWQDDIEGTLWLDLLRPFVAAKNLYLTSRLVPRIVPALQELVGGRTTEVLPTLENIFLDGFLGPGPILEGIEKFVDARRLASQPVGVFYWDSQKFHHR
jgi:hypothetical protein